MSEPALRVDGLEREGILRGVSFEIAPREFVGLIGPSGAGKSTILRSIAGLSRPNRGVIEIGGKVATSAREGIFSAPQERELGMVFQSYALWPHLTVFENLAFPLRLRRWTEAKIKWRVATMLARLRLDGLERRYPSQISGGQQQRVALGRALVYDAALILLDEPLANVDPKAREDIAAELREILKAAGTTILYVTHDQQEALAMCDRLILLSEGRVIQQGTAEQLYLKPEHRFTAEFFGDSNIVEGSYEETPAGGRLRLDGLAAPLPWTQTGLRSGARVAACWRYGELEALPRRGGEGGEGSWTGRVENILFTWQGERVTLATDKVRLKVDLPRGQVKLGDSLSVRPKPGSGRAIPLCPAPPQRGEA